MKATLLLKKDHENLQSLIAGLKEGTVQDKNAQFARIRSEIAMHSDIEEELLYPELQHSVSVDAAEIATKAAKEHHVVTELLDEMEKLDANSAPFLSKMELLIGKIADHIWFAEEEVFEEIRNMLFQHRIEELGLEMEQRRLLLQTA
jgi:hypothetical protein